MLKILISTFIAIFIAFIGLIIEHCFFTKENCPIPFVKASEAGTVEKTRLIEEDIIDDKQPTPLSFKISALYRANGKGTFQHFQEGAVLHSGDHIKLIFTPTKDNIYVYIFMTDSHGGIARLFPSNKFRGAAQANKNPIKKGQNYFVPAATKSFKLDNTIGAETIYFIVTRHADEMLEQQYEKMLLARQEQDIEKITLTQTQLVIEIKNKQRLIEPDLIQDMPNTAPVTFEEQGEIFSVLPQYLKNMCEGCVYQLRFQHR